MTAVLEIFAEAARVGRPATPMHAIFMAPWCERMPNGKLGPEYLPSSPVSAGPVSLAVAQKEHSEGRFPFSAGLWDHSQEVGRQARVTAKRELRADLDAVSGFMARWSHEVPQRELDVFSAFWVEGRSYTGCEKHLGMPVATIRDLVKRVRRRVAGRSACRN